MSSYRGPWDEGPPGAEQDYASSRTVHAAYGAAQPAAPPLHAMPATDPWTGVSYSQYGPPTNYDYAAYSAQNYNYNYDSGYYQTSDGSYYGKYPDNYSLSQSSSYTYTAKPPSKVNSPSRSNKHYDSKKSYRSGSRSVSPFENKEKSYSRKRNSSSDEDSHRSKSRSRSPRKHLKYSSSSTSRSRSHSSSRSTRTKKQRKSVSSGSERSYACKKIRSRSHSFTPPVKGSSYTRSDSKRGVSEDSLSSNSRKSKRGKKLSKGKDKKKGKDKRHRDNSTPPRTRKKRSITPVKSKREKSYDAGTPPRSHRYKARNSESPTRDSSLTPPRSYAVKHGSSSSRSRSKTRTPKHSRKRSTSPKSPCSRSHSASSKSTTSSRHLNSRTHKKSKSKHRSSSGSKSRSVSRSRSTSHQKKTIKSKSKSNRRSSKDKSRSSSNSSHSSSKTSSDEERRGQFTVSDRKRYWKKHRSLQQEKKDAEKTPPKEVKPPPGAVLPDEVLDINYGDPPEVEGPNFEEILPPPDEILSSIPVSSKSKSIPIPIRNDGSFLEMFKKMQEETKKVEDENKPVMKKPVLPFIGKRRGGRVLKTGMVKKAKAIDEQPADNNPKDAWSLYMQEVKKYRETSCEEERKTRPLVK